MKLIKDKFYFLVNKGKNETDNKLINDKPKTPEEQQKFMKHVMQGQKEDIEMQSKSFLIEGKDTQVNSRLERPPVKFIDPN